MPNDSWSEEIHLKPQEMLRFKCKEKTGLIMTKGQSEIYGTEFPKDNLVNFPKDFEGSLVSFFGCTYRYKTTNFKYCIVKFEEDSFCYNIYLNIHSSLEMKRNQCSNNGPRVMICGSRNTGKKNLCQILVNYRIRSFGEIIFVDTNVNNNYICFPGSMAALVVTQPYEITDGWHVDDEPLIINFGHISPMEDLELYKLQLKSLSGFVKEKLKNNAKLNQSGIILNASAFEDDEYPALNRKQKAELLLENIKLFQIDHVIIIEDGFLLKQLKAKVNSNVTIVSIPKSSESFSRNEKTLLKYYKMKLSSYFKGQGMYKFYLKLFPMASKDVSIYQFDQNIKEINMKLKNPKLLKINKFFVNSLLAVSQATKAEDLGRLPIYGYVLIMEISENLDTLKILTPSSQPIPSNLFLYTDFKMFF